jgi:hypothetical protein
MGPVVIRSAARPIRTCGSLDPECRYDRQLDLIQEQAKPDRGREDGCDDGPPQWLHQGAGQRQHRNDDNIELNRSEFSGGYFC